MDFEKLDGTTYPKVIHECGRCGFKKDLRMAIEIAYGEEDEDRYLYKPDYDCKGGLEIMKSSLRST